MWEERKAVAAALRGAANQEFAARTPLPVKFFSSRENNPAFLDPDA